MGKQAPKMSARVVNAIRNLREAHGSTSKEIMNYIMSQCNVPETTVQRQMQAALKRGLDCGILKKTQGHYFLNTEVEPQLTSNLTPTERYGRRSRRRRSSRRRSRRRGRRRSRGRRRRSRRSRRRSRRRRRGTTMRARRIGCTRCRCTKRTRNVDVLRNNPVEPQEPDTVCMCEKESNEENRSRQSRSRDHSLSRSRSSANSDRDGAITDGRPIHDQD
ncbi:probable splicing factor, arginine/serine-rich 5 [Bombus flavifrons]|uniref:probable splicing factor, arginine/serine-rich 5 n=1 Tax=Bombus flavifrons TaxID=103934 RepID=UPI003703FF2F